MKIILIFISLFTSISLFGCSPKANDDAQKELMQTTYYEETSLALPKSHAFTSIFCVSEVKPGILEIVASTKKDNALIFHYNMKEKKWSEPHSLVPQDFSLIANAIPLDNGSYFIECLPDTTPNIEYFTVDSDGNTQQLSVEENLNLHGLFATNQGILCGSNDGNGNYYLIDKKTGNTLADFNKNSMRYDSHAFHFKDDFIILSSGGEFESIETYNLNTGEKKNTDADLEKFLTERMNSLFLSAPSSNEILRLNSEGIHRFSINNGEKKVLLNSKNMEYSRENTSLYGAYLCQNHDIITWQSTGPLDWSLSIFTYSNLGEKETYTTLNVYMLNDKIIPDYLYSEFERKHPNIKLNLQYGCTNASAITASDAIKILNTELSAGKGPDIILLDGLPVTSYISKGMLKPIDDLLKELPSDSYLKNILQCYSVKDTTYAIPMGFSLPAILSTEAMISKASSLETLTSEVEKSFGEMLLPKSVYTNTVSILYDVYFDSCFKDGELKKDLLEKFYRNCEKLWNKASLHKNDTPFELAYSSNINHSMSLSLIYAAYANSQVNIGTINSLRLFQELHGLSQTHHLSFEPLDAVFYPQYSFGISANSKHQKEALEFLNFMLSDGQSFVVENTLALPVKKDFFLQGLSKEKKSELVGLGTASDDELVEIPAPKFEENEIQELLHEIEQTHPLQDYHPDMKTLVLESLISYLNKEVNLDSTLNTTFNKISIILKE